MYYVQANQEVYLPGKKKMKLTYFLIKWKKKN